MRQYSAYILSVVLVFGVLCLWPSTSDAQMLKPPAYVPKFLQSGYALGVLPNAWGTLPAWTYAPNWDGITVMLRFYLLNSASAPLWYSSNGARYSNALDDNRNGTATYNGMHFFFVGKTLHLETWSKGVQAEIVSNLPFQNNNWYHIGFTLAANGSAQIWVNGNVTASGKLASLSGQTFPIKGQSNVNYFGRKNHAWVYNYTLGYSPQAEVHSTTYYGQGGWDEIKMWSTVLTPQQIFNDFWENDQSDFNSQYGYLYYDCNEGAGRFLNNKYTIYDAKKAVIPTQAVLGSLSGSTVYYSPYWAVPVDVDSRNCYNSGYYSWKTFSDYTLQYQHAGDYIGARSVIYGGTSIEIRKGFCRYLNNPNYNGCVHAVAFTIGEDKIVIEVDYTQNLQVANVTINGKVIPNVVPPDPVVPAAWNYTSSKWSVPLSSGAQLQQTYQRGINPTTKNWYYREYYNLNVPFEYQITLTAVIEQRYTNFLTQLPLGYSGLLDGICGQMDPLSYVYKSPLVMRNGTVLPTTGLKANTWDAFGDTWKLIANDQNYFADPAAPIVDNRLVTTSWASWDPSLFTTANTTCGNTYWIYPTMMDDCMNSVMISGEIAMVMETAANSRSHCLDLQKSGAGDSGMADSMCAQYDCPNFCTLHGKCSAGQCICDAGWQGTDCSFQPQYSCFQATTPALSANGIELDYYLSQNTPAQSFPLRSVTNAITAYFHRQTYPVNLYSYTPDTLSLVLVNHENGDPVGKVNVSISITTGAKSTTPIKGVAMSWINSTTNTYKWDATKGTGYYLANWKQYANDGVILSGLPTGSPFCVNLNIPTAQISGISKFYVGSYTITNQMQLTPVKQVSDGVFSTIQICQATCTDPCSNYTDCGQCMADSRCGFCEDSNVCAYGGPGGAERDYCANWRYTADPTISRMITQTVGYPVNPSTMGVHVVKNSPVSVSGSIFFPDLNAWNADILYLVDVSQQWFFLNVKPCLLSDYLYEGLKYTFRNVRFGMATFSDKPLGLLGSAKNGDFVYRTSIPMTLMQTDYVTGLMNVNATGSLADEPQAQLEALLQVAMRTDEVGFATQSRIVIVVTDRTFHTPITNWTLTGGVALVPNNYDGVVDANENYPDPATLGQILLQKNIVPVFLLGTTDTKVISVYQNLVSSWGFGMVNSLPIITATQVLPVIQNALVSVTSSATIFPANPAYTVTPNTFTGVVPGSTVNFQVAFSTNDAAATGFTQVYIPGYGNMAINMIPSDIPVATAGGSTLTVSEDDTLLITLGGSSIYNCQLTPVVSVLPSFGGLYQYQEPMLATDPLPSLANSVQLTTINTSVSDVYYRLVYSPVLGHRASYVDTLSYFIEDNCGSTSSVVSLNINVVHVNHAPVVASANYSTQQETDIVITLNAADPDTDPVTMSIIQLPAAGVGSLYLSNNGVKGAAITTATILTPPTQIIYSPAYNQYGPELCQFVYIASDGIVKSSPASIMIDVEHVNHAPATTAAPVLNVLEDGSATVALLGFDRDGDTISAVITSLPAHGALFQADNTPINAVNTVVTGQNQQVIYKPTALYFGADSFTYSITDGLLSSGNTGSITANVTHVNHAPVATAVATVVLNENGQQTFTLTGTDVDGDAVTPVLCSKPRGSLTLSGSTATFVPNQYDTGAFNFSFQVTDGQALSACIPVAINVLVVPQPPIIATPASFQLYTNAYEPVALTATNHDGLAVVFAVTQLPTAGHVYATDASGNPIKSTPLAIGDTITGSTHTGTVTSAQVFYFVDPSTYKKTVNFGFSATCNSITVSTVVEFDVSASFAPDAPVATAVTVATNEDVGVYFNLTGVSAHAGLALTTTLLSVPTKGSLYQVGSDNVAIGSRITATGTKISNANGMVYFVGNTLDFGTAYAAIQFVVDDGFRFSTAALAVINVAHVNHAPSSFDGESSLLEDGSVVIALSGSDIDGDVIAAVIQTLPAKGQLKQYNNGAQGDVIAIGDTVTDALNQVYFVNTDYTYGADSFTFVMNDGQYNSDPSTVSLDITHVNHAPVANTIADITMPEDAPRTITLGGSDVDNDALTYFLCSAPNPASADLTSVSGGLPVTMAYPNITGTDVSFSPNMYKTGVFTFGFKAFDGQLFSDCSFISITVTFVPHPASLAASDAAYSVHRETYSLLSLVANSPDSAAIVFTLTQLPVNGNFYSVNSDGTVGAQINTLTTVTAQQYGSTSIASVYYFTTSALLSDSFGFKVDSQGFTTTQSVASSISINQTVSDAAPTAFYLNERTDENTGITFVLDGTDPHSKPLTAIVETIPSKGRLYQVNGDGSIGSEINQPNTIVSNANRKVNFIGESYDFGAPYAAFTFKLFNGLAYSDFSVVSINVTHVNHAPTGADVMTAVLEDGEVAIALSGSDVDGDAITAIIQTQPTKGTLKQYVAGDIGAAVSSSVTDSLRQVWYVPNTYTFGVDTFTFTISDGKLASVAHTVTVNITHVNHPPAATAVAPITIVEDTTVDISVTGSDVDGDSLTTTICTFPYEATLVSKNGGQVITVDQPEVSGDTITFQPDAFAFGLFTFSFRVSDGQYSTPCTSVVVNVTWVPHRPVVDMSTSYAIFSNSYEAITLIATNRDGELINFVITQLPASGTLYQVDPVDGAADRTGVMAVSDVVSSVQQHGDTTIAVLYYYVSSDVTTSDSFVFQAVTAQHQLSATSATTINLSVNNTAAPDAPVASDDTVTTLEDVAVLFSLKGSEPVAGLPLIATIVSLPERGKLYQVDATTNTATTQITEMGTVVSHPDRSLYFVPDTLTYADEYATVGFSLFNLYRNSRTAVVTLSVTHVHHTPVVADAAFTTREDSPVLVLLSGNNVDNDAMNAVVQSLPVNGTLYQYSNGAQGAAIKVGDIVADPFHQLWYAPTLYTYGTDRFTFTMNTSYHVSSVAKVSLTISHVNHAPAAQDALYTIKEDASVVVPLYAFDVDGDHLSLSVIAPGIGNLYQFSETATGHKGAAFAASTTPQAVTDSLHRVVFEPLALDFGTPYTTFTYFVSDNIDTTPTSAVISVNVEYVDHAPYTIPAEALYVQTTEDTPLNIALQGGDIDPSDTADTLTAVVMTLPDRALATLFVDSSLRTPITYVPFSVPNKEVYLGTTQYFYGQVQFSYKIQDYGGLYSDLCAVIVNVTHVNHAPVASVQSISKGFQNSPVSIKLGGADVDKDTLSVKITELPAKGTLYNTNADLSQAAAVTAPGTVTANLIYMQTDSRGYGDNYDNFDFVVNDGQVDSDPIVVSISLELVDTAPVAPATQSITVAENTATLIVLAASDEQNDPLTFTVTAFPAIGKLTTTSHVEINAANPSVPGGKLYYTPLSDDYSAENTVYASFSYTVNDGYFDSNVAAVNVLVSHVNQMPVVNSFDQLLYVDEGSSYVFNFTAYDVDGDNLVAYISTLPANGVLSFADCTDSSVVTKITSVPASIVPCSTSSVVVAATGKTTSIATWFVRYTPNAYYYTLGDDDVFTFNVTDNISAKQRYYSASVFVNAVNQPATITTPGIYNLTADVTSQSDAVQTAITGLGSVADDAGDFPILVSIGVASGSMSIDGLSALSAVKVFSTTSQNVTFTATLTAINKIFSESSITYSFNGFADSTLIQDDVMTIFIDDLGHFGAGGPKTTTVEVQIHVTGSLVHAAASTKAPNALISIGAAGAIVAVAGGYWLLKKKKIINPEQDDFAGLEEEHIANPMYQEKEYFGTTKNPLFDANA